VNENIEENEMFFIFKTPIITSRKGRIPHEASLRTGELFYLHDVVKSMNDFSGTTEICLLILQKGGGGTMVPKRYLDYGVCSMVSGRNLISPEETEDVFKDLDVEKEFIFP